MSAHIFPLKCAIQEYAWGKVGLDSEVAQLAVDTVDGFRLDLETPYAELWMGTHARGPSTNASTGETLSSYISRHPVPCCGTVVPQRFPACVAGELPFLFKVLSVNMALSIQVHPDKANAERLHRERPSEYPDPNHKPEMAIALSRFEALVGFRPTPEIASFLDGIPELRKVIGDRLACILSVARDEAAMKPALHDCFLALMNCKEVLWKEQLEILNARLLEAERFRENNILERCAGDLFLRIHKHFPSDIGCFCIYFLNFVVLEPGEAIFLDANLPHAYLYGNCLECMACSDNVVRAGLTPKLKDVATLCSILDYTSIPVSGTILASKRKVDDPYITIYQPPVAEFAVEKIVLPQGTRDYVVPPVDGPTIVIFINGNGVACSADNDCPVIPIKRGIVLFVGAKDRLSLTAETNTCDDLLLFRALCPYSVPCNY